ncbi:MAG: ATP-binding protein [Lachnospiraceae bacterium]|nr:ATP-binding protein [Lachnospiraceae bacterium]
MERNDDLVKRKIYQYMLTGVMTTVALQLGNVVDAMIVGNLIGSIGNSAVSASTPYLYVLQAAAILLGSGGAVTMAVLLGRRDTDNAARVMGFCMAGSLVYPIIFTFISPFLIPSFIGLTGASGELADMIGSITTVYSYGMPVISFVLVMAYLINIDNHAAMSARMHITSNAVNLVFDYILVRFTPLGITGAALSTVLGYIVSGLIFLPMYYKSKNRMVRPKLSGLIAHKDLIGLTCKNGFPNLAYLIMTVLSVGIINSSVLRTLGGGYFSAYAVANNTQLIVQMFLNGISSVIAAVAGVLFGEKDYYGMRSVLSRVLKIALLTGAVIMVVFIAVPGALAAMYGFDNEAVRPDLLTGLRIFSLSFGFFILNAVSQNYYRTTGQTFLSTASSTMQLLIFKVPLMLVFMKVFGFLGLFAAIIASELLSFAVLNLIRLIMQKMGKVPQKGFMAIPDHNSSEICSLTIRGSDETAVKVSQKVIDRCIEENIPSDKAQSLGIATEEIISNIGRYGYPDSDNKTIDVCLSENKGKYYLRFRDDGIPFNPVEYVPKEHEEYDIRGLELIRKLAVKMTYVRAISLNNTVIELDLCMEDE